MQQNDKGRAHGLPRQLKVLQRLKNPLDKAKEEDYALAEDKYRIEL